MYRVCKGWVIVALLLVTLPHFSDPPSGSEGGVGDDPRVVSTYCNVTMALSLFLDCSLPLRLFVTPIVNFLGTLISVVLFVCVASACNWQLLHDHGRTRTRTSTGTLFILLLLGDASQPSVEYHGTKTPEPNPGARKSPESRSLALTANIKDTRKYEHSVTRRMLLLMSGVER